ERSGACGRGRGIRGRGRTLSHQPPEDPRGIEVNEPVSSYRLMAVHAHPDDESSKGAATMARYAAEGHDVLVVTLTGGERGDILNPAMDVEGIRDRMPEVRSEE